MEKQKEVTSNINKPSLKSLANLELKYLTNCFRTQLRSKSLGIRNLDKGIYIDQIKRWFLLFPKENFFILSLESFTGNPKYWFSKLIKFLDTKLSTNDIQNIMSGIDFTHRRLDKPNKLSISAVNQISKQFRKELESFYEPYNMKLEHLLNYTITFEIKI
jgi:hypothetical protein